MQAVVHNTFIGGLVDEVRAPSQRDIGAQRGHARG